MRVAAKPATEAERLRALRAYEILDTPAEQAFDDLSRVASYICDTPIALVSLIDSERQWIKAKVGTTMDEMTRDAAFCAHTILGRELFEVVDTALDERFHDNPFVLGDPHIRFYAGMPLVTSDDHALGALCVIDRMPRQLTTLQREALEAVARQVVAQFEAHRNFRRLRETMAERDELLRVASHDLKNPLQAILSSAEFIESLLASGNHDDNEVREFTAMIVERARRMRELIEDLVEGHAVEDGALVLEREPVDLATLVSESISAYRNVGREKGIALQFTSGDVCPLVLADRARIRQVVENLLANAVKFSPHNSVVQIRVDWADGVVSVTVTDEGPGLTEADRANLFGRGMMLSARPTGGESSTGMGLFICKQLIDAHGGRIVASNATERGASFQVSLPAIK